MQTDATLLANNSQHCWMLHVPSVKPVKLFSQQLPTFLFFLDRRSVAQQCWIRLHSATLLGPRKLIMHGLKRLMGCILPAMHCRSQNCWELLHPFAHHCQHARNNQHCLPACRRLPFPLLHAEKGRLRNAVANRVPASRWQGILFRINCEIISG